MALVRGLRHVISFHLPFIDLEPQFWELGMCGGEGGHPCFSSRCLFPQSCSSFSSKDFNKYTSVCGAAWGFRRMNCLSQLFLPEMAVSNQNIFTKHWLSVVLSSNSRVTLRIATASSHLLPGTNSTSFLYSCQIPKGFGLLCLFEMLCLDTETVCLQCSPSPFFAENSGSLLTRAPYTLGIL